MARMYSRRKGKARSHQPLKKSLPTWLRYTGKELELLVLKLAKEGKTPSQIGIVLRDTYGIPDIKPIAKKSITQILKEKSLLSEVPEDLMALIKKNVKLLKHFERNAQDMTSKRGLQLTTSKIKRLTKYYKRVGKLPSAWKFDPKKASLMIE
ncbi:30S ribosomal protein S15 [Candidatus Woesearchaeota archaeon]|nr:30S ribosomal protein S15 [Candidatus Woesearchaeota archaeon]